MSRTRPQNNYSLNNRDAINQEDLNNIIVNKPADLSIFLNQRVNDEMFVNVCVSFTELVLDNDEDIELVGETPG